HLILNKEPKANRYGVTFSQLHSLDLIDMDGDGLKDIVTGKRVWAHGPHGDPEPNAPAVLYWFKLVRPAKGQADFIPYLIDNDSGVGTQVVAGQIRRKKAPSRLVSPKSIETELTCGSSKNLPDIVVGNKKGVFVF